MRKDHEKRVVWLNTDMHHACEQTVAVVLVAACLGATPLLQRIPSAVLWGYFAFMALESLQGSQFWERLLWLLTDPGQRYRYLPMPNWLKRSIPYVRAWLSGRWLGMHFWERRISSPWIWTSVMLQASGGRDRQLTWRACRIGLWPPSLFSACRSGCCVWSYLDPCGRLPFPLPIIALIPLRTYLLPRVSCPLLICCVNSHFSDAMFVLMRLGCERCFLQVPCSR